jgi:hypothetical protein
MFKQTLQYSIPTINRRLFCLDKKWDIFASVHVERLPVIAPELNIIEKAMDEINFKYEKAKGLLSDHEVRKIRDK